MAAMEWVYRYPDDFAGCVLINTSGKGVGSRLERLRPAAVWTFAQLLVTRRLDHRERLILKLCTAGTPAIIDRYLPERVQLGRRSPVKLETFMSQIYAAACFRTPRTLRVPVLVLAGQKDRLTHPRCSRRLSARLGAELQIHPLAGHELTLDDADWVAQQAATWAKRMVSAAQR
jgi:pimeloyl-ACP methyl ester carboxylesterase